MRQQGGHGLDFSFIKKESQILKTKLQQAMIEEETIIKDCRKGKSIIKRSK
jgi:hypothetical protein